MCCHYSLFKITCQKHYVSISNISLWKICVHLHTDLKTQFILVPTATETNLYVVLLNTNNWLYVTTACIAVVMWSKLSCIITTVFSFPMKPLITPLQRPEKAAVKQTCFYGNWFFTWRQRWKWLPIEAESVESDQYWKILTREIKQVTIICLIKCPWGDTIIRFLKKNKTLMHLYSAKLFFSFKINSHIVIVVPFMLVSKITWDYTFMVSFLRIGTPSHWLFPQCTCVPRYLINYILNKKCL